MDFDLNDALNSAQFAVYATDERPKRKISDALPPAAKRTMRPASTTLPATRTAYGDLPAELILKIASHVGSDDIAHLSVVDRRSRDILRERRICWSCCKRANTSVDLASMQQLLNEIDSIQEEPSLRFDPVAALWFRLHSLPAAEQTEAFKRLFNAAARIPRHGHRLQELMIESIAKFAREQQIELFDFAYAAAEQRRADQPGLWLALASTLTCLPLWSPQFTMRYQALVGRLASMEQSQQAELVALLAGQLFALQDDPDHAGMTSSAEYATLQLLAQRLPASLQGAPVGALAAAVWALPNTERQLRYTEMRRLALSLPHEQLIIALHPLLAGLSALPPTHHANELSVLESALIRMTLPLRIQAASQLIESTPMLERDLSKQVWRHALRLMDGAAETDVLNVIVSAANRRIIAKLSDEQWHDALIETMDFVQRNYFTKRASVAIVAYLAP